MTTLEEITVIGAPIERCFDLARNVEVHLAGNVHWGESALAIGGVTSGLVERGQQVTWRARHFAMWHNLTSEITEMDSPRYFQDRMLSGPFRSMQHEHHFCTMPSGTVMRDVFHFSAPLPIAGSIVEFLVLRRYMQRLLHERCEAIRRIAESEEWKKYLP